MVHMDVTPYADRLRVELAAVASASGPEVQEVAERIAAALGPALRLTLLDVLTDAAAEISAALPSGSVEVRLRSGGPAFVLDVPPPVAPASTAEYAAPDAVGSDDSPGESDVVRITLRLPEPVKVRAEELAARTGRSLNAWIVAALSTATQGPRSHAQHMTGWV